MKFTNTKAAVVGIDTSSSGEGQNGFPGRRTSQRPKARRQLIKTLRVMKLTAIILLAACLQLSAKSNAQDKVTLLMKDAPLEKVLRALEKQGNYIVWCEKTFLIHTTPITVQIKNVPLDQAMAEILKDQPLKFTIIGKVIVISENAGARMVPNQTGVTDETIDLKGKVTNNKNEPLLGASIEIKGTKKGTVTDKDGNYELKNVDKNAILLVSYTGYISQEIKLNGKDFLFITLSISMNPMDAVQIIAYGTTTERLNTGNVTSLKAEDIEKQPVSNPLAAMEGRVPGLIINQTSGIPGGSFTVQIRGQNSLLNGNDPFYVIDGVPYSSQTVGIISASLAGNTQLYGYNNSAGNPLNYLNPSDIESISILKDADATSIYGSRAANGAILITTKKGKTGDSKMDFNIYTGLGKVTRIMPLLNTRQYLNMRHEAFSNDDVSPDPTADFDLTFWDTTRYTNWQKLLIGNSAHYNDAQLSVSGGNDNIQYLIGGGYHSETTVFPGTTSDQKASVHFNLNSSSSNKKLKISLTAGYIADMSNVPSVDLTGTSLLLPPDAPVLYNTDRTLNWMPLAPGQWGTWSNPVSVLQYGYRGRTNNLVSNSFISYTIAHGLEFKTSIGYTHTQTNEIITYPTTSYDPASNITSGNSLFNTTNAGSWIVEPQVIFTTALGKGTFKALAGATFQQNAIDRLTLSAKGFSNDALLQDIQAATNINTQTAVNTVYRYNAFFGRLNYNWKDKIILSTAARRDGSSRFGPGSQFANFASVGAAWIFSKENFLQNLLPVLSFGKLRASYGTSGNDQVGDYRFLDLYRLTQYPYQTSQGLYPANLFNPNLAWELSKKLEGGIELGILKDRIMVEVSYFRNRTNNQLVTEPLSLVTGFSAIATNLPALVQNSGIELVLTTANVKTRDFKWTSSLNLTIPRNKLLSFPNLSSSPYKNRWIEGKPISIQKLFQSEGVNDSAGIYQFKNTKGTDPLNPLYPGDLSALVNPAPRYYGGFENNISYKGIQLDILFQFVKQIGLNVNSFISTPPGFMSNQPVDILNRWQKSGDITPYQQFTESYSSNATNSFYSYYISSNAMYSDASFIRLKNLAISYNFSNTWMRRLHVQNFRVYIHGQNLLTITNYLGLDPETQGIKLPPLRVWTAGIQLGL